LRSRVRLAVSFTTTQPIQKAIKLPWNGYKTNTAEKKKRMLIKISEGEYVNSDAISYIYCKGIAGFAQLSNGKTVDLTRAAFDHIVLITGADESMLNAEETAAIPPPSLQSKTAILLRDTLIQGATQDQLESILNLQIGELSETLSALMAEGIVKVAELDNMECPLFFHANHVKPKQPNPALSV
jgi:hypothetical protein